MTVKRFALLAVLVFAGVAGRQITVTLSSDALGMAVGIVFGVLAGVPTALLMLAAGRRQERRRQSETGYGMQPYQAGGTAAYSQPPVIVLTGGVQPGMYEHGYPQSPGRGFGAQAGNGYSTARPQRRFQVVGDSDGIDEW